jgi:hypothetical protein
MFHGKGSAICEHRGSGNFHIFSLNFQRAFYWCIINDLGNMKIQGRSRDPELIKPNTHYQISISFSTDRKLKINIETFCGGPPELGMRSLARQSIINMNSFFHLFIHSSMALELFVGTWLLTFSFVILYTVGRTPWTGDQPVAKPLRTHRTEQI